MLFRSCTAGTFSAAPSLLQSRYNHTAVLLKDGRVWFAGGRNPAIAATGGYLVTTERYDPGSNAFQSASPMIEARSAHTATLMGDGKALVIGGYNKRDVLANKGITESAEIYDPISNSVTPAGAMSARRQAHATVLGANGEVTVFGGLGNITTTYIQGSALNLTGAVFEPGSTITSDLSGGVVVPTTTITGGSVQIKLDYLLDKPVFGQIADGEMWLSSPAVHTAWGAVYFTPANQLVPATGLRINLAGAQVGCRTPGGVVAGNCGNIQLTASLSQMQNQIVYYRRTGVAVGGGATVSAGTLDFSAIDDLNVNGTVTGGSITSSVKIKMDNGLIGRTINAGTLTITDVTLTQPSSFTVVLDGGVATIPSTVIGTDGSGNGEVTLPVTFTGVTGSVSYGGAFPQAFPDPAGPTQTVPMAGANMNLIGSVNMTYSANGANLSGETFEMDIATVVIRRMVFADAETYNPKTNSWVLGPPPGVTVSDQRFGHSVTLLPNNDKVFIGGRACSGGTCATQVATANLGFQLLYSENNFAAAAGAAAQQRAFHTSTMLPDGDILVAGGTNGPSILSDAELFTPGTELFSPVNGEMRYVRDLHTATLLPNGRVLIAGGFTTNAASTGSTNTAEIYYPETKRFIETSPMISSRSNHSAIMLPDGRVFVAGGFGTGDVITGNAEIYLSTSAQWMPVAAMPGGCERAIHATVQLRDGRIRSEERRVGKECRL